MTVRELLLEQLAACHDRNGWFVAMSAALEGLTAEQAAWRQDDSSHSIWQIVNHLFFWNDRDLRRFQGLPVTDPGENAATFDSQPASGNEDDWRAARAQYRGMMDGWMVAIEKAEDARLEGPVGKDAPELWCVRLTHMFLHAAHHIGQIVAIRKAQGSWNPKQGVS